MIYNPDGTLEVYTYESYKEPNRTGTFSIDDKWTDSEGNIWYKVTIVFDIINETEYRLCKLSDSGKTLEFAWSPHDYPTEIDPNSNIYGIYYSQ